VDRWGDHRRSGESTRDAAVSCVSWSVHATIRRASNSLSHPAMWFQLAKMRVTFSLRSSGLPLRCARLGRSRSDASRRFRPRFLPSLAAQALLLTSFAWGPCSFSTLTARPRRLPTACDHFHTTCSGTGEILAPPKWPTNRQPIRHHRIPPTPTECPRILGSAIVSSGGG
jgi:hypothetical protein